MLLGVVGAWAEVTPLKVSTDAQKHYYVIKSLRTGKYAYYNGDAAQLLQQVNPTSATEQGTLNKYLWYVTEAPESAGDGAYMLHNVATTKVYAAYNSFTDAGAVVYIKENPYRSGYVCVSSNADAKVSKTCWDDQGNQTNIGLYETRQNDNEGTSWSFIEIESQSANVDYTLNDNVGHEFNYSFTGWNREMLPVVTGVANYTLSTPVFEDKIVTATINFPFHVSSAENVNKVMISSFNSETRKWYAAGTNIKTVTDGNATRENVDAHMWNIYPQFADGKFTFKIKNYSTNTFIKHNGTTDYHKEEALSLATESEASAFTWEANNRFQVVGTNQFLSTESSSTPDQYLGTHHSTTHNGSRLSIFNPYYYSDVTLKDECGTIYEIKNCKINEAQDEPAFTGADGYTLTDKVWDGNTLTATINFPVPVSSAEVTNQAIICPFSKAGTHKYFAEGEAVKANKDNTMPFATNVDAVNYLWAFYPSYNNGAFKFKIKNIGTGTYISSNVAANDHSGDEVVLVNEAESSSDACLFTITSYKQIRNNKGYDLSVASESAPAIRIVGTYNSNHNGTKNKIICANNYTLTLSDGSKYVGTNGVQKLMNSSYTFTNGAWNEVNGYTANVEFAFPFPVSSAEVANIVLMSIGGDQRKWSARKGLNDEYYIHILNDTPELGTWQWVIYPQFEGGVFKYKIMNVATGKYVYAKPDNTGGTPQPEGWVDNNHDSYPVILNDEGTAFAIEMSNNKPRFTYQSNSNKLYLTVNGSGSNDCPLGVWTGTHSYEDVTFPELQDFNVTIGSAGYATLYSPITVVQEYEQMLNPETLVEIYQIKDEPQNGSLTLSQENYVLKNEGVILKGNPGTYRFGNAGEDWEYIRPEDWTDNKLSGSETNTYIADEAYVLSAPDGVVGLYKADLNFYNVDGVWTKDAENGTHFKNNAGKAYLPASALSAEAAESRFFLFGFGDGEETGITETENGNVKTENTEVYDLAGRRVQNAQKGIFIVNGKKVVR